MSTTLDLAPDWSDAQREAFHGDLTAILGYADGAHRCGLSPAEITADLDARWGTGRGPWALAEGPITVAAVDGRLVVNLD